MSKLDLWVEVKDGEVISNVSSLPLHVQARGASKEGLINSGWYPVESVKPDGMDYKTEVWENQTFEIKEDHVVWTLTKRSKLKKNWMLN